MINIIKLVGALFFIYSANAWSFYNCKTESSGVTINTDTLIIQRDITVGSRLATQEFTSPSTLLFTCPSGLSYPTGKHYFGVKSFLPYTGMDSNGGKIFKTNLPGLGIQLGGFGSSGVIGAWVGLTNNIDGNVNQTAITTTDSVMSTAVGGAAITFYKIDEMTSGTLTQKIGGFILGSALGWSAVEIPLNISGLKVSVLTCSVTTPTVTVPIGNVYATDFTGVGKTVGDKSFDLGLNCAAGTKVNVALSGTQNVNTADTSVLALTGAGNAGVAKGIGAQILYNNSPLKIGSKLLLKTSAGGMETFPFKARYYQTLDNVMPGSANATATLNITYQ